MNRLAKFVLCLLLAGCGTAPEPRVVLYCAQDRPFAETVLGDFDAVPVVPKFDTEADKSVSLYEELVREAGRPRCDVHWGNEPLATIRLARKGLLEPYASPQAAPYPEWARAADHTWHAFASRARVLIVNTDQVPEADRPTSLFALTDPRWRGRVAMARPMFGTTATHAACLWAALGPEKASAFYRGLKANGVVIVAGNKQVAEAVGRGDVAVGMTDTDDALLEVKAGRPVAIVYPDGKPEQVGTLFLPNMLGIVKGGPNPAGARRLVDFLLSAEVEKRLAEGGGYQIPLNPKVTATLPAGMRTPAEVKAMAVKFEEAAERWEESQTFLRNEFGGG